MLISIFSSYGHHKGEADRTYLYRPQEEIGKWMEKCSVEQPKTFFCKKVKNAANLREIHEEIKKRSK